MPDQVLNWLEECFWPRGERRDVWFIVDAARSPKIFPMLLECHLEYACLYSGTLAPQIKLVAPYLVRLDYEYRDTRRFLKAAWGNSWGILLKCDARLDQLRRHLRTLLTVRDSAGTHMLFRFYDPRVLRIYLPTCFPNELRTVFGPIESFWMENDSAQGVLEFRMEGSSLASRTLPSSGRTAVAH